MLPFSKEFESQQFLNVDSVFKKTNLP